MISISAGRERDNILILVNDNGTGIPEPELADIRSGSWEAETVYLQEKSIRCTQCQRPAEKENMAEGMGLK